MASPLCGGNNGTSTNSLLPSADKQPVSKDSTGGIDVYINMDNVHLLNQLRRETRNSEHPLINYWFKYGLLLAVMGMLQEQERREKIREDKPESEPSGESEEGVETHSSRAIEIASSGLAPVIVPIIRRLAQGPTK